MRLGDKLRAATQAEQEQQEQQEQRARERQERQQSAPRAPQANGSNRSSNGVGPFDKLDELAEWSDILDPVKWESVKPADADTQEAWRHPGATHPISAKVLKAKPHVLVVH
jgi:hypothetical protein